jgi:hypothetical protein
MLILDLIQNGGGTNYEDLLQRVHEGKNPKKSGNHKPGSILF